MRAALFLHVNPPPLALLRPQPLAQALAAMLERAEPPICVGLYARWGSGKTFMISLLKKEFDPTVQEHPKTRQLLQFFEKGYKEREPKKPPAKDTVISLICGLLLNILLFFLSIPNAISRLIPYWVTTSFSIIYDAFDPRKTRRAALGWCSKLMHACLPGVVFSWHHQARRAAWAWCSRLKRSCGKKGRTTDSSEVSTSGEGYGRQPWRWLIRKGYSWLPQEELKEEDVKRTEFIFVDFNAWTCAACVHTISFVYRVAHLGEHELHFTRALVSQVCSNG